MQDKHVQVSGVLGGPTSGSYDCLTPDKFDTYYPILRDTVKKYHLTGLELDFKPSVPSADIKNLITHLRSDFGDRDKFALTLAPDASDLLGEGNSSGFDYVTLEKEMGGDISWYNAKFYSEPGSSTFPEEQYINITKYAGGMFYTNRVVARVLTDGDDGSGYIPTIEVVRSVGVLLKRFGTDFGGVAGWEYFNSKPFENTPWVWTQFVRGEIGNGA